MRISILIFLLFCLWGCQVGPEYHPPAIIAPEEWKHAQNEVQEISSEEMSCDTLDYWWEIFQDDKLNELESLAMQNNHDLHIAFERIMQARALAGIVDSNLYPQLNLSPSYLNREILWMLYDPVRVIREHRRRNEIPLVMNYEVDLWGKYRKASESAFAALESQEQTYLTATLILTADLASNYFLLRTLDAEIELYEGTVMARNKAVGLMNARFKAKIAPYSDLGRADLEYTNTKAEYSSLLKARDLVENQLAILIGMPASDFQIERHPLRENPPTVPAGVPSDVLIQRPDIAAAERQMASNNAAIGVAYASFFPSISLTGALGFSSPELKDFLLWKSRLALMGTNINEIIFDGGRLYSNFQLAISKFREANESYQQVVLKAFQEVEDSLASLEKLEDEYQNVELSVLSAKKLHKITYLRYSKGVTFYLDVVDSERQELRSERDLIQLLGQRYEATIDLIRSLGGTWGS